MTPADPHPPGRPQPEAPSADGSPVSERASLLALVHGYQISHAVHVAAALGLADLVQDGARASDELARATDCDPRSLHRLLRVLASAGVFREEPGRRFALTPLGDGLRRQSPDSLASWAAFQGRSVSWQTWGALLDSVRKGENAYRLLHSVDAFEYRARDPDEGAAFDTAMAAITRRATRRLLAGYDFGRFGSVVDVGGGQGALLAALLAAHPSLRGVLFDQPDVVAAAEPELRAAGVADRCRVESGSFFDAVPAGGDAYVLSRILHDWADDEASQILRSCRRAIPLDGTLLVIEHELGPANENLEAKLVDLTMLVAHRGQERTLDEHAELLASAGFELALATPIGTGGLTVIEAKPV